MSAAVIVRAYGEEAVLVELPGPTPAVALRAALEAHPPEGTIETIPGLQTVLIRFDPRATDAARLAAAVEDLDAEAASLEDAATAGEPVEVHVDYRGPDLAEVSERVGLSVDEVVAAHTAPTYRVALIGMAPGFYYLAGGDPRLAVPRRATPRTDVPKGALGIAGHYSGIYPRLGPGGWMLIGTVLDDLWHPTRIPAALLAPGSAVIFRAA